MTQPIQRMSEPRALRRDEERRAERRQQAARWHGTPRGFEIAPAEPSELPVLAPLPTPAPLLAPPDERHTEVAADGADWSVAPEPESPAHTSAQGATAPPPLVTVLPMALPLPTLATDAGAGGADRGAAARVAALVDLHEVSGSALELTVQPLPGLPHGLRLSFVYCGARRVRLRVRGAQGAAAQEWTRSLVPLLQARQIAVVATHFT